MSKFRAKEQVNAIQKKTTHDYFTGSRSCFKMLQITGRRKLKHVIRYVKSMKAKKCRKSLIPTRHCKESIMIPNGDQLELSFFDDFDTTCLEFRTFHAKFLL